MKAQYSLLVFLILLCGIFSSDGLYAQTTKLFIVEADQTLNDVLKSIGKECNVLLAYPTALTNDTQIPAGNLSYNSTTDLLQQVLQDKGMMIKEISDERFLLRASNKDEEVMPLTVSGTIIDDETNEGLAFAAIYLKDFSNGTMTDVNGHFSIQHPFADSDTLVISYLAYQEKKIAINEISGPLTIKLEVADNNIENILVEYVVPPMLSTKDGKGLKVNSSLNNSQTIVGNDLMRQLQMLPGVSAHNDDESDLKIRGSNADQSRVILDGMPLYNLDHYYGVFSSVNADYIEDVSIYKNAQPIQYRSSGGGLLLLESKNNADRPSGKVNINLLNSTADFSLPISKNITAFAGLRTTYRNVEQGGLINSKSRSTDANNFQSTNPVVHISNEPEFRFHDFNLKLVGKLNENTSVKYALFNSSDKYENSYDLIFEGNNKVRNQNLYSNIETWDNFSNALTFDARLHKNWYLHAAGHYTHYEQGSQLSTLLRENIDGTVTQKDNNNLNESSIKDVGGKLLVSSDFRIHNINFGFDHTSYNTLNYLGVNDEAVLDQEYKASLNSGFISYTMSHSNITIDLGNRVNFYDNTYLSKII